MYIFISWKVYYIIFFFTHITCEQQIVINILIDMEKFLFSLFLYHTLFNRAWKLSVFKIPDTEDVYRRDTLVGGVNISRTHFHWFDRHSTVSMHLQLKALVIPENRLNWTYTNHTFATLSFFFFVAKFEKKVIEFSLSNANRVLWPPQNYYISNVHDFVKCRERRFLIGIITSIEDTFYTK